MNGSIRLTKKLIGLSLAICTALTMSVTAFADVPYESYNYDYWDDAIPSQSGYTVQKIVSGKDMGLDRLSDPNDELYYSPNASTTLNEARDVFVYNNDEIWIADTGNSRILRLNKDYEITGRYYYVTGESQAEGVTVSADGNGTMFSDPYGIYLTDSPTTGKQTIYIADYSNARVIRAQVTSSTELTLEREYLRPDEALYDSPSYNPTKVLADSGENVYVIVKSVTTGSVQFSPDGEFMGYYGANRVEVTAKVIAQRLWRKIATNKQISGMQRNVPVEYANFDIDSEGFIYTVTEVPVDTDSVKKINAAGYNIWADEYDYVVFGDHTEAVWDMATSKTYATRLTDVAVDDNGIINVLDYETGRVFQYDKLCNLICIFGTKTATGDQRGAFASPNAVETIDDTVIVLDGSKNRNDLTVFKRTLFGDYLHKAFGYYDEGLYVEAQPYWEEVIKRDSGYADAHIGLGKADLKNQKYKSAMKRFKIANSKSNYDKAFEYYREQWLQDHFTAIAIVIFVLAALGIVDSVLKRKNKSLFKIFKKKPEKWREGLDGFNV